MDDCSPTHAFPNLHLPQPFHIILPNHHSAEPGYPAAESLPNQEDHQTLPCFPAFDNDQRESCDVAEQSLLGANSLDEDFNMGSHFEGEERHSWYIQKDTWDESPTDEYYAKANCYRGHRDATSHNTCSQLTYNRKANSGYAKQATYFRDNEDSSGNIGLDYSRTNLATSDLEREDFGSSRGLNEEQLQSSVDTSHWLTGENVWRGESCTSSVTSQKTLGLHSRAYTQKLDSFSDAFMSQAKRRPPVITTADGHFWDNAVRPRLSCSLDSDSSSPSLPSFPSPPSSNLLSPPPTPLPPASHSPSKVDSPSGGSLSAHAGVQGGEALGAVQFFPVRTQSVLGPNSSGMVWRLPLFSHCFTQLAGEASSADGNERASNASSFNYNTGPNNVVQSLVSSSPVLQSPRALYSSVHPFFHSTSPSSLISTHQNDDSTIQKSSALLGTSHNQDPGCPVYTGTTFPSMLQCESRQRRAHFTPQPLLNPLRRGTGLYSSVRHKERECGEERQDGLGVLPCINVGADFQADIPPCLFGDGAEVWSHDEEEQSPRERLLWKPWDELTYSATVQDQVEKLLQMSSSSCLPGGGTNTELALHCLHHCHGDIMATLEMLLLSQPMPAGDYHYPGADVWTETEKRLFTVALETHGKDLSLIQTLVKTKTVTQCVEFYYLRKRLDDKQKAFNMEEASRVEVMEQPKNATPTTQPITRQIRLEEMVPVPLLATSFPCKLCGKMFYKIKSRNAHMKIHRQPQEDWTERKIQQQMLNRALNHSLIVQPQTFTENNITNGNGISLIDTGVPDHMNLLAFNSSLSHVIPSVNAGGQISQEPASVLQFQSMWSSFGQNSDAPSFYSSTDVKTEAEEGTAAAKWK